MAKKDRQAGQTDTKKPIDQKPEECLDKVRKSQERFFGLKDSHESIWESRFRQMADNIQDIFWITDARGATPVYVSPAYETTFGRTVESLFDNPHTFFDSTHPDDRNRLAEVIRKQRTVDYSCEIEYRIIRGDGEVRWLWARLCSIVDDTGVVIGLCGVTNDITERKEAEKRVSEFYSTVSHEL